MGSTGTVRCLLGCVLGAAVGFAGGWSYRALKKPFALFSDRYFQAHESFVYAVGTLV